MLSTAANPRRRWVLGGLALALTLCPAAGRAQQSPATLSLDEAIALARRHNPEFLSQQNNEVSADWGVREAYGGLLPTAFASTGLQYQARGRPRFGIFTAEDIGFDETPAYYLSDYYLGLNYQLGAATFFRLGRERAAQRAAEAETRAAEFTLAAAVTRQYLTALRARDGVALARQELQRAEETLKLAQARVAVGAAIPLEEKQAAVERGRAEVVLLQAENLLQTEKLRLLERLGMELERDVELTSAFQVFEPRWSKEELVQRALSRHPQLEALHALEQSASAGVRMARSAYLPTLELSAGWSGFTRESGEPESLVEQTRLSLDGQREQCELLNQISAGLREPLPGTPVDCSGFVLTDAQRQRILDGNNTFPFDFSSQPPTFQLRLSLPIFQGFSRQRQVESARVAAQDARHRLRAEELRLKTEVAAALQTLATSYRTVGLDERNRELGDEQLRLARERYRVGAASFVDLLEAETIKARADRAYLVAVYSFHEALAALEAAVGEKLAAQERGP